MKTYSNLDIVSCKQNNIISYMWIAWCDQFESQIKFQNLFFCTENILKVTTHKDNELTNKNIRKNLTLASFAFNKNQNSLSNIIWTMHNYLEFLLKRFRLSINRKFHYWIKLPFNVEVYEFICQMILFPITYSPSCTTSLQLATVHRMCVSKFSCDLS